MNPNLDWWEHNLISHKKYPILKLKEVVAILSEHGFSEIRSEGSHHHYMATINDQKRVVTVDHGKTEFDVDPIILNFIR